MTEEQLRIAASKRLERDGKVYAGYKDSPDVWEKGSEPEPINWYAGMQYDGDVAHAKQVLEELDKYYPGAKRYEVAGFFWWQGDKDSRDMGLSLHYEENLVALIKQLRVQYNAPKAKVSALPSISCRPLCRSCAWS